MKVRDKWSYSSTGYVAKTNLAGTELIFYGAFAGLGVFFGLPLAALQTVGPKWKGFLNAFATGILIFLMIDAFGDAWNPVTNAASRASQILMPMSGVVPNVLLMCGGLVLGLFGLGWKAAPRKFK